jgi:hypothetical protein
VGNTLRNKSASVAWKDVCLPKNEGSLDLFDIKARNKCFLAKQLWNIHLKTNLCLDQIGASILLETSLHLECFSSANLITSMEVHSIHQESATRGLWG